MVSSTMEHSFSAGAIRRLFAPWENSKGILFAISGGPDSVALMLMAAEWVAKLAAAPRVFAATVDHGLRESASGEAQTVSGWAAALGLGHATLVWEGIKPKSRIQELAREARYQLLFRHAARIGAGCVMTAHHADDQAETILFRLLRGSGISGLAGIPKTCERSGVVLARPLLEHPKSELVAFCKARGHPFIEDPSNADPAFARTRLKRVGSLLAREGLDRAALLRLGSRAARADAALAAQAREVCDRLDARRGPGVFEANISLLAHEPDEVILRILACELELAGCGKRPRLERLETLAARLAQALCEGIDYKATLGGAALRLKAGGTLTIVKERERQRGRGIALGISKGGVRQEAANLHGMQVSLGKGENQA